MATEKYNPHFESILFSYRETEHKLYISSIISVEIENGETLNPRETDPQIPQGQYAITLHYDAVEEQALSSTYTFKAEPQVQIADNMTYQGPVPDLAAKINDIRQQIAAMLSQLPGTQRFFSQGVVVFAPDGEEGGQDTKTINQNGEIVID